MKGRKTPVHDLGQHGIAWTLCNVYKDQWNPKSDYNHGIKKFKICKICPQNTIFKFDKRNKK